MRLRDDVAEELHRDGGKDDAEEGEQRADDTECGHAVADGEQERAQPLG